MYRGDENFDPATPELPPVTAGSYVLIQIREARHYVDGQRIIDKVTPERHLVRDAETCYFNSTDDPEIGPDEVDWYNDPEGAHKNTICTECLPDWAQDYYISLGETPFDLGLREKI